MDFLKRITSPNFDKLITPEFIILHYSGGSYNRIRSLFEKPDSVSAHFVIDLDGKIDNVVSYQPSACNRAWHAGKSEWRENEQVWTDINSCSIGIELVNLNGNIIEYKEEQIRSLVRLCNHLFSTYPNLKNPHKIIGHEHIAGVRGKVDPGILFPWEKFLRSLFNDVDLPERKPNCPPALAAAYKKFLDCNIEEGRNPALHHNFWHAINFTMEKTITILQESK